MQPSNTGEQEWVMQFQLFAVDRLELCCSSRWGQEGDEGQESSFLPLLEGSQQLAVPLEE